MGTSHIQTACNTHPIYLFPQKKELLKLLLGELQAEALQQDFSQGFYSSMVDCCQVLIEMLEGRYE